MQAIHNEMGTHSTQSWGMASYETKDEAEARHRARRAQEEEEYELRMMVIGAFHGYVDQEPIQNPNLIHEHLRSQVSGAGKTPTAS